MTSRDLPAPAATGRRGRRPGGDDTRGVIIEAARSAFAAKGYDRASLRGIARDAGVDPALVHHYFKGGKAELFAETLAVPINPAALVERIITGDPDRLGWRVIETFLAVWDAPERRETLTALIRSSMTTDESARMLREYLGREVFGRIAAATGVSDPELGGALAASQVVGMAVMRYIVKVPALAEASNEQVVARLGPVLQHYLMDNEA
ncbi:MAG: TetR family transcriptional regulator [Humibacillus sp.]|nr:TetR family transcriptional regulator [Humibacillus sp.]MDN5777661.1 TetR family transcriptional regulator [Humibacillus sp.]